MTGVPNALSGCVSRSATGNGPQWQATKAASLAAPSGEWTSPANVVSASGEVAVTSR